MNRFIVVTIIAILTLSAVIFAFKYYRVNKQNNQMKSLLTQAVYSVERDNNRLYSDLEGIIEGTYMTERKPEVNSQKDRLYLMYNSTSYVDSLMLVDSLLRVVQTRVALNDSLVAFYKRWFIHGLNWSMIYGTSYLEHHPIYRYGDTINYIVNLHNPPYFIDNTFEIADYTQKQYGSVRFNKLTYLLPTVDLMDSSEARKEVKFTYRLIIRNTYSQQLDTTYRSTKFIIYQ